MKRWRGPEYEGEFPSLGWDLIETWSEIFPSPRDETSELILTDEQARNVIEWYRVHPITGEFVYRRGCSRRSKGSGKSPLEAAKCISELALPVRFAGWDANGDPVARPWGTMGDPAPWVQIASLSEDQDENTYTPLYYFLTARDGRLADELKIDAGLTRCFLRSRTDAKIEPVTSRAGSREGQPVTYANLDESGLMTKENGGVRLARTIRRNLTKTGGRGYETTNGFMPGEESVAEQTDRAYRRGSIGIFYDAVEAPTVVDGIEVNEDAPDAILKKALTVAYGDAWWVGLDRVLADIRDDDMPWEDAQRWFFNWNRKGSGRAVDPKKWDELKQDRELEPGAYIGLGFDGSEYRDATVLVACTDDGCSFVLGYWAPQDGEKGWEVPRGEVREVVASAFVTYDVGLMLCDPPRWHQEIDDWAAEHGEEVVLKWDTNQEKRIGPAVDRWLTAIRGGTHIHAGDERLSEHVKSAQLQKLRIRGEEDDRTLYRLVKPEGEFHRIDAAVADVLAFEAAMTMPEFGGGYLFMGDQEGEQGDSVTDD